MLFIFKILEKTMKRLLFCLVLNVFAIISNAQSIGSFLDFHLGQSMSEVRNIVNYKYPSATWKSNECTIDNISIAGENFKGLCLKFDNNKLKSGQFFQSDFKLDAFSYENAKRYVDNVSSQYINMISRLYSLFKSKYGKESYFTNDTVVWREANGNSITIKLRLTVEDVGYGTYAGTVGVWLTYEASSNLGNY